VNGSPKPKVSNVNSSQPSVQVQLLLIKRGKIQAVKHRSELLNWKVFQECDCLRPSHYASATSCRCRPIRCGWECISTPHSACGWRRTMRASQEMEHSAICCARPACAGMARIPTARHGASRAVTISSPRPCHATGLGMSCSINRKHRVLRASATTEIRAGEPGLLTQRSFHHAFGNGSRHSERGKFTNVVNG
jgi:hypothetical protein